MHLVDSMPEAAQPEDPIWTTSIMTYELGGVVQGLVYARHKRSWGDEESANAREKSARINLADLIVQCQVLAEQMRWPWMDLENDGMERFLERMAEIAGESL